MRTVSLTMRAAMNAQETGEIPVVLLTITHPDLATPIRLSSDPTTRITTDPLVYGTVSRGQSFQFLPFSVVLPDDKDEAPPSAHLVVDNIDRELIALIRSTSSPATVAMEMVLASAPDSVEILFPELDLVSAEYDQVAVNIGLAIDALLTEPYPAGAMNPSGFPGLF
jgi:hypothetical protein